VRIMRVSHQSCCFSSFRLVVMTFTVNRIYSTDKPVTGLLATLVAYRTNLAALAA
jgi:hypothetical protein